MAELKEKEKRLINSNFRNKSIVNELRENNSQLNVFHVFKYIRNTSQVKTKKWKIMRRSLKIRRLRRMW